ncbi:MAG TPA: LytR C-terminal domain-containing protein [Patescibacteria group bacterium]|nr:LytR C-terminal domain-containing protein [Patescibacteria group bacterium]
MPNDKTRKRVVVEEVPGVTNNQPIEEVKEKVEELQGITEHISDDVQKSSEIQEDLAKAAEEVVPMEPVEPPQFQREDMMPQIKSSRGPSPAMIIIPGIFLLGALLGGIIFYQRSISKGSVEPTPTSPSYDNTITVNPTSAPITQTTLDLTKYPINVMNGSGTPGQAGTVKDLLVAAGFTVSKAGNAPSYDYTKTVIKAKVDVPAEFLTKLTSTLSKTYVLDTTQPLATSSADSVQVIIGSTKAQ